MFLSIRFGHKNSTSGGHNRRNKRITENESVKVVLAFRGGKNTLNRKFVRLSMNRKSVKLQLDTGSDLTIISKETGKRIIASFVVFRVQNLKY